MQTLEHENKFNIGTQEYEGKIEERGKRKHFRNARPSLVIRYMKERGSITLFLVGNCKHALL